jgi:WXXGXW repeat (2 copies)
MPEADLRTVDSVQRPRGIQLSWRTNMNRFPRFAPFALLALAVLISTAGCKSNQNAADTSQTATPDASSDPASANLAPISNATSEPQSGSAPAASGEPQSAPPAADSGAYSDQGSDQTADDASYGEQPVDYAPQPPPELPDYQQPPAPGDDYLWTPGYWNYASAGYYWVPGVWVQAPYQGALWTPGYWGWTGGRYGFFRGYWGPHIGFYGGINYGFGYGGAGYQGGYWNSGHFFYNRSVNNINVNVVHNVYNYRVVENHNARVAFNGGRGGVMLRPRPAELAALREPHAAPMRAQIDTEHSASTNRAQFASENHGRPASAVIERPLAADRDVHPVAAPAARFQPAPQQHGAAVGRPEERPNAAPVRGNEPARPAPQGAAPGRPQEGAAPGRPQAAPPAAAHPPANQPRPEERPAPHAAPAQPAQHPQVSQPRPEERPAPHAAPAQPASHPPAKPEKPKPEEKHPQ